MVGRELGAIYGSRLDRPPGEVALELTGLTRLGAFADIALQVRAGGPSIAGTPSGSWSYRRCSARTRSMVITVRVFGREVAIRSPRDARAWHQAARGCRPMACCCSVVGVNVTSRAWPR